MATQKCEQGQERQAENGEVVALDPLEQMDAGAFELIGADALRHRRVVPNCQRSTVDSQLLELPTVDCRLSTPLWYERSLDGLVRQDKADD